MMGTLPPNPQDLTLHCHPRTTEHRGERTHPGLVWPLSQRSGRIPALPYPPFQRHDRSVNPFGCKAINPGVQGAEPLSRKAHFPRILLGGLGGLTAVNRCDWASKWPSSTEP